MLNKKCQLISTDHTTGESLTGTGIVRRKSSLSEKGRKSSMSEAVSSLGIFYMFLSSISFTFMSFGGKLMYNWSNITPFEAIYFRGSSMVLLNIVYSYFLGLDVLQVPKSLEFIMWIRTFIGTAGICLNFVSYKLLPISIANTLFFLYPLITSCGGYIFLKEKMNKLEIVGMFVSFIGVICVVKYSQHKTESTADIPLLYFIPSIISAFTATGVYLLTRKMGKGVHFLVNPTWFGVVQSLIVMPIWLAMRSSKKVAWSINSDTIIATIIMCLGGWLGQVFMNKSLQIEKAGRVAVVGYIQIPLLFLFDVFYFKEAIKWQVILGSVLIIICSFSIGLMRMLNVIT